MGRGVGKCTASPEVLSTCGSRGSGFLTVTASYDLALGSQGILGLVSRKVGYLSNCLINPLSFNFIVFNLPKFDKVSLTL